MYLFALDKKQMTVSQKFTHVEFADIMVKNNLTEEQLVNEIQKQLYTNLAMGCAKNIRTAVVKNDTEVQYSITGFILTPQNITELLREILDMSQEDREKFLQELTAIPVHHAKKDNT
jgi:hypothetical protein